MGWRGRGYPEARTSVYIPPSLPLYRSKQPVLSLCATSINLHCFLLLLCTSLLINLSLTWDSVLYLGGRRTQRFLSEHFIQHVKTTCEKAGKMTYAASGQSGNPRVTGFQAEIKSTVIELFRTVQGTVPAGKVKSYVALSSYSFFSILLHLI